MQFMKSGRYSRAIWFLRKTLFSDLFIRRNGQPEAIMNRLYRKLAT